MNNPLVMILPASLLNLLLIYWGYKRTKLPLSKVFRLEKFDIKNFIPLVFIIVGASIICSEMDNFFRFFLPAPEFINQIMNELVSKGIGSLIALVIIAPVIEELIFRGLILNGLLSQYSVKKSAVISALLFALIHINPYQFAGAFIWGVLAAYILIATKSLLPCIICHALYNGIPYVAQYILKIDIAGYTRAEGSSGHSFQPLWFDVLGIVVFSIGLFYLVTYYRWRQSLNKIKD